MNKELQDFLKKELQLSEEPNMNHAKISSKLSDMDKLINQLYLLRDEEERECWKEWLMRLKQEYPGYELIDYSESQSFPKVGLVMEYKGYRFSVLIEKEKNIYYGFGRHEASDELHNDLKPSLVPIMDRFGIGKETPWWYGWKYTSFENGFDRLKKLIDETIGKLKN